MWTGRFEGLGSNSTCNWNESSGTIRPIDGRRRGEEEEGRNEEWRETEKEGNAKEQLQQYYTLHSLNISEYQQQHERQEARQQQREKTRKWMETNCLEIIHKTEHFTDGQTMLNQKPLFSYIRC